MSEYSVDGLRVVVVGAARSGVAAAELLVRRGARVILTDVKDSITEANRIRKSGITLELGGHRQETLEHAELIVLSPGVSPKLVAIDRVRRQGTPVISEIELAARWLRGRVVAVTGTKGKSTTTVLTGRMLEADGRRALVGGNLGTALSSQVEMSSPDLIHVVEASSFQLELTETFRPWISVLLNLSPDHLDRHSNYQEYVDAKARIFANQTSSDAIVINADDPHVLEVARRSRAKRLMFAVNQSLDEGVVVAGDVVAHRTGSGDRALLPVSAVQVPGRHYLSDVLAAVAVGTFVGISARGMCSAVESFTGLAHSLEPVGKVAGVQFINDSKATNILSARAAMECFDGDLVVIMGGRFKGGDLKDLRPVLKTRVKALIVIGESRSQLREAFGGLIELEEANDLADAVRLAFDVARPSGTVLLAPACASLDMFTDYAERGRAFKAEVGRLQVKES